MEPSLAWDELYVFSTRVYIIERGIDDDVMTGSVTARPTLWHPPPPPPQEHSRLWWPNIKPSQARRPTFFRDLRPALTWQTSHVRVGFQTSYLEILHLYLWIEPCTPVNHMPSWWQSSTAHTCSFSPFVPVVCVNKSVDSSDNRYATTDWWWH